MHFASKLGPPPQSSLIGLNQVLFGWDADKTYTPSTVRNELDKPFLEAYHAIHDMTGGHLFTFTNSGMHGLDTMFGGRKLPALVSQGTLLRIEEGADYIRHPDLTFDPKETIDAIDTLVQELISKNGHYQFTRNAADIYSNPNSLKGEHKDTCYCIVFNEDNPEAKKKCRNYN
jgi:hypothetical protein